MIHLELSLHLNWSDNSWILKVIRFNLLYYIYIYILIILCIIFLLKVFIVILHTEINETNEVENINAKITDRYLYTNRVKELKIGENTISGWYDRKDIGLFRWIEDVNFIAAMGPPGGGRNPVTPRLLRHFHFIAFPEMEEDDKVIFKRRSSPSVNDRKLESRKQLRKKTE